MVSTSSFCTLVKSIVTVTFPVASVGLPYPTEVVSADKVAVLFVDDKLTAAATGKLTLRISKLLTLTFLFVATFEIVESIVLFLANAAVFNVLVVTSLATTAVLLAAV
ncbi:hypothetical protein D1831_08105 [Lactiplantibacillus garii]|uniref:Uncharacterized protein n=1 Tax=Lactiplantibacillus garii TaxID=2306423 RepID=A0A3R8J6V1_9LACO|nr:hypothetical protein D1831_08105 [Lactiplantibacillus garii]